MQKEKTKINEKENKTFFRLPNNGLNEKVNYFNTHKKKDDLADSFLQGMWFINNRKL